SWGQALTCPMASNLTRLQADRQLSMVEPDALADAPFGRLRRLEADLEGPSPAIARLTSAAWFRRLRELQIGFDGSNAGEGKFPLADLPQLHSLCLWGRGSQGAPGDREFPALRRLLVDEADLRGERGEALGRLRVPRLMDLSLRNGKAGKGYVAALAATPLF